MADDEDFDLGRYVAFARRQKWTLILTAVVVGLLGTVLSATRPPVYETSARLLIQPDEQQSLFNPYGGGYVDLERVIDTEIQVLTSGPVAEEARRTVGADAGVSASTVGQTNVVAVTARDRDPGRAARIANAFATAYVSYTREQQVDELLAAAGQIQQKVSELAAQIAAIDAEPRDRDQEGDASATARREALVQQQAAFKVKLDQLQVDAALKRGGARLVTRADVPSVPASPRPKRDAAVATVLGLVLGAGLALVREHLDNSIKGKDDLDRLSADVPTLAIIPQAGEQQRDVIATRDHPGSPLSESYRGLRTSIQFMGVDAQLRTVQFTSAVAGEGKSTTVANLAVALAQAGQRVIVLSCDLRLPIVHEMFGLPNDVGFTSVLLGQVSVEEALKPVADVPRLHVMTSGPTPPNPSELLSGRPAMQVIAVLQTMADVVLIDSAPVLPVTDAAVLSRHVDGTVLVVRAGATTRKLFTRAVEMLRQVDAPLVGTVLNGVAQDMVYGYGYGYGRNGTYGSLPDRDGASDVAAVGR